MPAERKISDEELAEMRRLFHDEGWSAADLAAEFGVTPQHTGRLTRGEQRPVIAGLDPDAVRSGVVAAVDAFLKDADLGAGDTVLAATRALASKLDGCQASDAAAAAQAAPRLAAELVAVLERLQGRVPREPDAVDRLRQRREARHLAAAAGANGREGGPAAA